MSDLPAALRRILELSREPGDSAFHVGQVSISFGELVDAAALRVAWEAVAAANPPLCTVLDADGPHALPAPAFGWRELDWRTDAPADLGAAWQELFDADGATPVTAEPHRFTIIHLPNGGSHGLWTFHAALLDEPSVSTALQLWLLAYDHVRLGADLPDLALAAAPAPPPGPAEKAAPASLLLFPLPAGTAAGTRISLSHTFERPERAAFASAAGAVGADLSALAAATWSFVLSRAHDAEAIHVFENQRPADGLGRLETFALVRRDVASAATAADLIRAHAEPAPVFEPTTRHPSTQAAFLFRDLTINDQLQLALPRWMAADAQFFARTVPPITLRFIASDRPTAALDFDPATLSPDAARALFDAFCAALVAFAQAPDTALATFSLPGTAAVVAAADAPSPFRSLVNQSAHDMFADAAAETPDAIAVEGPEESLTFSELNTLANQVARLLHKRGVKVGQRVAVAMDRSPQWVAATLGALKAGATVVLPAPDVPVDAWIVDALPEGEERTVPVLQMRTEASALAAEKSRGVAATAEMSAPAITWRDGGEWHTFDHAALAHALQSLATLLELSPGDRILQFAPTRDFSAVEETLATLLSGATLVLRPNQPWGTRTAFQEFIAETNVTALAIPTPFWTQWTHYLAELALTVPETLRVAVTTGSQPAPNAAAAWPAVAGATRWTHRFASASTGGLGLAAQPRGDLAAAMLGQPGPACIARVADRHGLPQPFGFPGHVEIAPASAPADFRPLPLPAISAPDGTFFDLPVVRASVGAAEPELNAAAIRLATIAHPQIFDAHVETRLIAARQEWCLWIVPRDSEAGEPHDLRDWLAEHLPVTPRRIRALPRFPLDEAGQLDLAALNDLLPDEAAATREVKGSEDEERVREALSRALGGRRLELDEILTEGRTKPPVAQRMFEAVVRVEPRVQPGDFATAFSVRSLVRTMRSRKPADGGRWTPLVPLRASGRQAPLIFLHGIDGTTDIYSSLVAHLGNDQPCYGITARGVADPADAHTTIESMATAYLEALRDFDTHGGFRLVGYDFGGLVAFEMARQLRAAGAAVPLLVLLATEPPAGGGPSGLLTGGWLRALPSFLGGRKAEPAPGRRRIADGPVLRANQEAARRYVASPAPGDAHIFVPEDQFPAYRTVQQGWSRCCPGSQFFQVPCSGPEMMEDPAAEDLANVIGRLARAEQLESGDE